MLRLFKTLVSSVLLAGCSVVGVRAGTDEPKYALVGRLDGGVEVRTYASRTAAETTVAARGGSSNEGRTFSLLAGYIFGGNKSNDSIAMTTPVEAASRSTKIAMTTPVQAASATGSYQMRFFLPPGYDAKSAPVPNNSSVRLVDLPEETMATLRFSGSRNDDAVDLYKAKLLANLERSEWKAIAEPVALFYDPPWTLPPLRRNEVAVLVARR